MENEEKSVVSTIEAAPSATDRFGAVMCHTGALIGLNILIPFLFTLFVKLCNFFPLLAQGFFF